MFRMLTISALLLTAALPATAAGLLQQTGAGTIDWGNRWIEATGSGLAKATGNPGQERLLAVNAAKTDALRQLAETVYGVRVDAETTVRNYVTESDIVKTRVDGVIKGAVPVGEPSKGPDGETRVTLRMPLYGEGQLSDAIDLDQRVQRKQSQLRPNQSRGVPLASLMHDRSPGPLPFFASLAAGISSLVPVRLAQGNDYTGLVIDMCSVPLQPAMSPAVFASGQRVYIGDFPINPDQVIEEGVLQYFDDFGAAIEARRVGARPLVVDATGTSDGQTDIFVSEQDAERIRAADAAGGFLQKLKVVVAATP